MSTTPDLVQIDLAPRRPLPKPEWLRARAPMGDNYHDLKKLARSLSLHTVCESAKCPNMGECWPRGTATFMILGNVCTRCCGFCNIATGRPAHRPRRAPPRRRSDRPSIKFAVITCVNRDETPRRRPRLRHGHRRDSPPRPRLPVEVLIPDFQGDWEAIRLVLEARPEILNHNTETVPRLYRVVRSGARYERTLRLLQLAKEINPGTVTKSGVMVGLGEEMDELLAVYRDLASVGVNVLTIGQYLRPSKDHLPIARYYTPEEFAFMKREELSHGLPPRRIRPPGPLQLPRPRTGRLPGQHRRRPHRDVVPIRVQYLF